MSGYGSRNVNEEETPAFVKWDRGSFIFFRSRTVLEIPQKSSQSFTKAGHVHLG